MEGGEGRREVGLQGVGWLGVDGEVVGGVREE